MFTKGILDKSGNRNILWKVIKILTHLIYCLELWSVMVDKLNKMLAEKSAAGNFYFCQRLFAYFKYEELKMTRGNKYAFSRT